MDHWLDRIEIEQITERLQRDLRTIYRWEWVMLATGAVAFGVLLWYREWAAAAFVVGALVVQGFSMALTRKMLRKTLP